MYATLINMLQTHCRNCLILWSPFSDCSQAQKCRAAKGCGLGSGILGTHWPQQHVCFHASFIHFITSLDECDGVEEKPCYLETEREEPHSIFSSPGPAFLSACSLHTWITLLQGLWGVCAAIWAHYISRHAAHMVCHEKFLDVRKNEKARRVAYFLHYLYADNCIQMAQLWCPFLLYFLTVYTHLRSFVCLLLFEAVFSFGILGCIPAKNTDILLHLKPAISGKWWSCCNLREHIRIHKTWANEGNIYISLTTCEKGKAINTEVSISRTHLESSACLVTILIPQSYLTLLLISGAEKIAPCFCHYFNIVIALCVFCGIIWIWRLINKM